MSESKDRSQNDPASESRSDGIPPLARGRGGKEEVVSDGDRGIPQVGRNKPAGRMGFIIIVGVVAVALVAGSSYLALDKLKNRNTQKTEREVVDSNPRGVSADAFNPRPTPLPPGLESEDQFAGTGEAAQPCPPGVMPTPEYPCVANYAAQPGQPVQQQGPPPLTPAQQAALDLAERRKRAPLVAASATTLRGSSGGDDDDRGYQIRGNSHGSLGQALTATRTGAVSATQLPDPNMTITQGTLLPCILETALNSQLPGMTSCVLARNIYSTNGRVLLMERGTRIVGQYQTGQVRRGISRVFILWTRAETPNGVLVHLDSPATDTLGRSGMTGRVNSHFWERFGAALLVSVVDDAVGYAMAEQRSRRDGGNTYNFRSGESARDAAAIIVENSVNIPPTIEVNQGAHVGIFTARDLYFGDVYGLAPARSCCERYR